MTSERIQRRIEQLLDQADAAVAAFDWATVRNAAGAVLALDPENADAKLLIAAADRALAAAAASPGPRAGESEDSVRPEGNLPPVRPEGNRRTDQRLEAPASFASGRYQLKTFLGEGARKRVYLAHDTRL